MPAYFDVQSRKYISIRCESLRWKCICWKRGNRRIYSNPIMPPPPIIDYSLNETISGAHSLIYIYIYIYTDALIHCTPTTHPSILPSNLCLLQSAVASIILIVEFIARHLHFTAVCLSAQHVYRICMCDAEIAHMRWWENFVRMTMQFSIERNGEVINLYIGVQHLI